MTTANKQARKKEMKNTNEQKIPKTMLEASPRLKHKIKATITDIQKNHYG
jgi:hypothetical protein